MANIRGRFYSDLRTEFEDGTKDSFLYRYLKQEKEDLLRQRRREGVPARGGLYRGDAYLLLQDRYLDLQAKKIKEADYWETFFSLLVRNSKLRLREDERQLLWQWAARGKVDLTGVRQNRQRYEHILTAVRAGRMPPLDAGRLTGLHEALLHCILVLDANTFLYDGGSPALGKPAPRRKKDRTMDMLEAYCEAAGLRLCCPSRAPAGQLTEQELADYEAFFQTLRAGKNTRILMPLLTDNTTGAGLYIVGRDVPVSQHPRSVLLRLLLLGGFRTGPGRRVTFLLRGGGGTV